MGSLTRRSLLRGVAGAAVAGSPLGAWADGPGDAGKPGAIDPLASRAPPDLTVLDLAVEGDPNFGRRFTLFYPNDLAKDERVPLLVLLHGLGETWDLSVGVYAWVERYGLGTAHGRLRRPPVRRTSAQVGLFTDAHLASVNAALAARPFRGLAIACPYTPNVQKLPDREGTLDAYAAWIADVIVPRARKEAPVIADRAHTAIDGVSLGGFLGLEVLLRRPEVFGAWGGVQAALNVVRLSAYVDRLGAILGKGPETRIHIETAAGDPSLAINTALSTELAKKGVPSDLVVLPGVHDQIFLREAGTLSMLLWHERRMHA